MKDLVNDKAAIHRFLGAANITIPPKNSCAPCHSRSFLFCSSAPRRVWTKQTRHHAVAGLAVGRSHSSLLLVLAHFVCWMCSSGTRHALHDRRLYGWTVLRPTGYVRDLLTPFALVLSGSRFGMWYRLCPPVSGSALK